MSLRIAILGTRGIPNNYGGFEQIAGYLAKGLTQKGHSVSVYNSHNHPYEKDTWYGVNIIHCFDPEFLIGTAGQFIYDLNCILDSREKKFDIILMLGYTSSSIWGKLYPEKSTVIINMDGLEWKRSKYSTLAKKFLLYAEKLAIRPGNYFIADSIEIKKYLYEKYKLTNKYIPYGAEIIEQVNEGVFSEFDLEKFGYFLLMARMEPENNIELILDAFHSTGSGKVFIVIGNTKNRFGRYLLNKYATDKRIRFIGGLFNKEKLTTLIRFSYIYFHGHSVGGTNPSLLEAMAAKAFIVAHDNLFNKAVLGNDALFFTDLADVQNIISNTQRGAAANCMIENNIVKIKNQFSWDTIVEEYEQFFYKCCSAKANKSVIKQPQA
jgi:Glycosyltransferase